MSNPEIGYTVSLPAHWTQIKAKPAQDYFRDSTKTYRSQISIVRYAVNKADYPTPQSWSQAQFIAYKLSVETSVFPYGAVTYYDSTPSAKIGPVWAPEAISILYPADGSPTYMEYIRYCAIGDFGYEIYAIGDSADLVKNVDYYAGIIATMRFTAPVIAIAAPATFRGAAVQGQRYDALGRLRERKAERPDARFPAVGFRHARRAP